MTTVPPLFSGLIDDAAIFPPGDAPLPEAVAAHWRHRATPHADVVGPFVCTDRELPRLGEAAGTSAEPLACSVVVLGGAGAVEPAVTWAMRDERLWLRSVEVALRDEDDLARNARRLVLALENSLPEDVAAFVELPRGNDPGSHDHGAALDVLAEGEQHAKFRTGGLEATAYPSERELADLLLACLDRETSFKLTAGLHHLARRTDPDTGHEEHGFGNILLATRAALDGATSGDVADVLAQRDAAAVAAGLAELDDAQATGVRRWFLRYGSCDVRGPIQQLGELGLLPAAV